MISYRKIIEQSHLSQYIQQFYKSNNIFLLFYIFLHLLLLERSFKFRLFNLASFISKNLQRIGYSSILNVRYIINERLIRAISRYFFRCLKIRNFAIISIISYIKYISNVLFVGFFYDLRFHFNESNQLKVIQIFAILL
ncbi:transmembrane protein, putative (macronuclear) [Tetrahymena thermophila SB210]|uniref:Transmembrane protein, putative n=1 Tax=Tetrahymena thermophila (strain SB210) TaxID=312017 RepID=W7X325_TETTS|nr:transmembrane protein, putative [Tetrahymena thermophila SB210]EWS73715.1 transmembrane protein, putative [Tetrahymena thermophila SB210]|eukprot:XP_012653753.1 transmembrane protein, putative [Tetrahymena thermophila SB210]